MPNKLSIMSPLANMTRWHFFHVKVKQLLFIKKKKKEVKQLLKVTCFIYLFIYYLFYQGYQFWTIADENGRFSIDNVRIGDYNLYAWVPGVIGDYKYNAVLPITPGLVFNVMKLFKFISNPNVLLTYYFIVI